MSTKWVVLFSIVVLALAGRGMFKDASYPVEAPILPAMWQEATPYPMDTAAPSEIVEASVVTATPETTAALRPPSEAGQNMVLIIGALLLVLIVFLGVAVNSRKTGQDGQEGM